MNAFQLLREQDFVAFDDTRKLAVRERVEENIRSAEFFASLVELYVPVMADTLAVLVGGDMPATKGGTEDLLTVRDVEDDEPYGPGHSNVF